MRPPSSTNHLAPYMAGSRLDAVRSTIRHLSRCRNASHIGEGSFARTPIRYTLPAFCASAASGAASTPASEVSRKRRRSIRQSPDPSHSSASPDQFPGSPHCRTSRSSLRFDFYDHLNLNCDVEGQVRHPDGGAGVLTDCLAKDFDHQIREAVDDLWLIGEPRS
jgi:hypothetical protein